jgi:ribosomal protein L20A (L18A)
MNGTSVARPEPRRTAVMPSWEVSGRYLAARARWQSFAITVEAATAAQAREWILSEIGGCHHVRRSLIQVSQVQALPA